MTTITLTLTIDAQSLARASGVTVAELLARMGDVNSYFKGFFTDETGKLDDGANGEMLIQAVKDVCEPGDESEDDSDDE